MSGPPGGVGHEVLSAYLDGELDAARRLAVERHLARCPDDAELVAAVRTQDAALRLAMHDLVDQDLPARLAAPLEAARHRRRLGALAAAALLALVAGFGAWHLSRPADRAAADLTTLVQDAVATHRGYVAARAGPIAAPPGGQRATATATMARDDTIITAPDLARFGYRMVGSQLIVTGAGPAIQFLYADAVGQEVTCFFAAFAGLPAAAPASRAVDGVEAFYRVDEGIGYVVAGGAPPGAARGDRGGGLRERRSNADRRLVWLPAPARMRFYLGQTQEGRWDLGLAFRPAVSGSARPPCATDSTAPTPSSSGRPTAPTSGACS